MKFLTALIFALCLAVPFLGSAAEVYQISFEIFDESSQKVTCTYHSRTGEQIVIEQAGRFFCPRVLKDPTAVSTSSSMGKPNPG